MIQIPITLPKWNNQDIVKLVNDFVKKGITHDKYKDVIGENIDLISTAIENNPREIKRFLNNFIVAYEIFSPSKEVKPNELLVIQAIQIRWGKFYDLLMKSDDNFRLELKKYVEMKDDERSTVFDSKDTNDENYEVRKLIGNFKDEFELWNFLLKNLDTVNGIKDWSVYRRATEVSIEPHRRPKESIGSIFLSYSRRDGVDLAIGLKKVLIEYGYKVMDEVLKSTIQDVVGKSEIVVVIATKGAMLSPAVESEVKEAQRLNKLILPVWPDYLAFSELKWGLDKIQGIQFSSVPDLIRKVPYSLESLRLAKVPVSET